MDNLKKLEYVLNVVNKRLIPAYLSQFAMRKLLDFQFNHCKQSVIINKEIIEHFVGDQYEVKCYEGFFNSSDFEEDYNHCWNYLISKDGNTEKNIICDFTSTITYMCYGENDPTLYLNSNNNSVNKYKTTLTGYEELNYEEHINEIEFYTGLKGESLNLDIQHLLKMMNLW